jgi:hypothetical protein
MLKPTIYVPSRLTRALAALELALEAQSQQERYCIGRIDVAPISRNVTPIRAVA